MNYLRKQAAIAKLSSVQKAINYVLRTRMTKRAEGEAPPTYRKYKPGVYLLNANLGQDPIMRNLSHSSLFSVHNEDSRNPYWPVGDGTYIHPNTENVKYLKLPNGQFITQYSSAAAGPGSIPERDLPVSSPSYSSSSAAHIGNPKLDIASQLLFRTKNYPVYNGNISNRGTLQDVEVIKESLNPSFPASKYIRPLMMGDNAAQNAAVKFYNSYESNKDNSLGPYGLGILFNKSNCHTTTANMLDELGVPMKNRPSIIGGSLGGVKVK